MSRIRAHLNVIVAVIVTAALTAGAPAIAHGVHAAFSHNADKVDGLHAVKAGAPNKNKRLVATSKTGKLPVSIIPKADADTLDGQDSSAFLGANAKAADADMLDGQDSTDFLDSTDKAADSDLLDGQNSSDFLGASGEVRGFGPARRPGFD